MKIIFIVQGEGRGHLTQAITMEKLLTENGHEVVKVLVGKSKSRSLPEFFYRNIKADIEQFESPNFLPSTSNRGCNLLNSILYNVCKLPYFIRSIAFINKQIKETNADLVINFYELLTGLTYLFSNQNVPQISIAHQYMFLHKDYKFPKKSKIQLLPLIFFTKMTCYGASFKMALSMKDTPDDMESGCVVVPPLIRKEVKKCTSQNGNYILGYMVNSGFSQYVKQWHRENKKEHLHFFWDKKGYGDEYRIDDTLSFHKIDDKKFIKYMSGCSCYATTAGFESVCEAYYLGKPIMMTPVHIEQDCNAHEAEELGVGITSQDFDMSRLIQFSRDYRINSKFKQWADSADGVILNCIENINNVYHPQMVNSTLSYYLKTINFLS